MFLGCFASHVAASPDDTGGGYIAWLFASLIQALGNRVVKGGMHNLPLALAAYVRSKGGEIRTGARVNKIIVKDGRAAAVQLSDGEEIDFSKVVSVNTDPRQLIVDFLGEEHVGSELVQKMQHQYEWGDAYMTIYLALDKQLTYRSGSDANVSPYVHSTDSTLEYISRVYAECRSGYLPAKPFIVMCNDTAVDPGRAPDGKAVMKFIILNVPYDIKGDAAGKISARTWDDVKEAYADHIIDIISDSAAPGIRDLILKRVVHSPLDMERNLLSAVKGTVSHGGFFPYQSGDQRPLPGLGQYRMPVPNVYLCGSGAHPAGGITMAPGRNAAQVILKDLNQ
ncbi:MAG TPA: NAD(P)/FAD-dependent oxidoreductase [Ignavibacteria bacterium]|nr:NAD(P)/FAD-dependent oxidoreductase [Ignavibacteria bacterium]HMR41916.1 NAD(P)/FAD-dependent oxidoreductase [Ignavibacteria bacterium]